MYLWKCWRDTRIKFLVVLGLFLCLEIASLFGHSTSTGLNAAQLQDAFLTVIMIAGYIVVFVGWILGDDNPGADIGRGSGDFLLTRPSSRGHFVWTGWMVGMVESVVLWIVFSAMIAGSVVSQSRHGGISAPVISAAWLAFSRLDLAAVFLMFVINLGLVYGLTYCIGVVLRSGSRALIGSAALLLGYQILKVVAAHEFHLFLPEIFLSNHGFDFPAVHEFVFRGLFALALPALSHVFLERMEI